MLPLLLGEKQMPPWKDKSANISLKVGLSCSHKGKDCKAIKSQSCITLSNSTTG